MGPLEFLYYIGYSLKKFISLRARKRLPSKVISIGNITVGGTGKTPAVIALAERAIECGYLPCILTRGYRGKAKDPCHVSTGNGSALGAEEAGDEALLMATRLRSVPVVKGKNRYEAGLFALEHVRKEVMDPEKRTIFLLDDGFQHWRLFRDIDILLIDSTNPFGNGKLLPSGTLREPLREIGRADVIVLTKTKEFSSRLQGNTFTSLSYRSCPTQGLSLLNTGLVHIIADVRRYNPGAPIFFSEHVPSHVSTLSGTRLPVEMLMGKDVFGFCGIGNPQQFRETIEHLSCRLKGFVSYRDHHRFTGKDVTKIVASAEKLGTDWIVTTEKDIMRLAVFDLPENLVALGIEFYVEEGFYDYILRRPE
jgi:tetraacyldisaccharide 4'-kinase